MFKRLLLASCIFSSTFAADDGYIDPDFALLTDVHDLLSVEKDRVFTDNCKSYEASISRLHTSTVTEILQSQDPKILDDEITNYTLNAKYDTYILYIALWEDTSRTKSPPLVYADFLRQIFWNRVTVLSKLIGALLSLPHNQIESELLLFTLRDQKRLEEFCKKYDSSDVTPFTKLNDKQFESFIDDYSKIISNSD
jgi:hypothetical protein